MIIGIVVGAAQGWTGTKMATDLVSKDDLWHKFLDLSNDVSKLGSARDAYRHCANIVAASLVSQSFCEACWEGKGLYFECANCGKLHSEESNYCPHCGAKMLGMEE